MGIPIRISTPEGPKIIGTIADGVFSKRVCKSKHFCRMFNAWGVQEDAIPDLKQHKCKRIKVIDTESDTIYTCSFEAFLHYGIRKDLGSGVQIFLPVKYWQISYSDKSKHPKQLQLALL